MIMVAMTGVNVPHTCVENFSELSVSHVVACFNFRIADDIIEYWNPINSQPHHTSLG